MTLTELEETVPPATVFLVSTHDISWATDEVARQGDDLAHVVFMLDALQYARAWHEAGNFMNMGFLTHLAARVKPSVNRPNKYRYTPVSFDNGRQLGASAEQVPRLVAQLCMAVRDLTPSEFAYELLFIHPWIDGNGRTASLAFNFLNRSLDKPLPLPKFDFG